MRPISGCVESNAKSHAQQREIDAPFRGWLLLLGSTHAGRDLGLPSDEGHTERSLSARVSQALIELLMFGFPISGFYLNRIARIKSLKSKRR